MADIKQCDFPRCTCTKGVQMFNLAGFQHAKDEWDRVDICPEHMELLLRLLLKNVQNEIAVHAILKERGALR